MLSPDSTFFKKVAGASPVLLLYLISHQPSSDFCRTSTISPLGKESSSSSSVRYASTVTYLSMSGGRWGWKVGGGEGRGGRWGGGKGEGGGGGRWGGGGGKVWERGVGRGVVMLEGYCIRFSSSSFLFCFHAILSYSSSSPPSHPFLPLILPLILPLSPPASMQSSLPLILLPHPSLSSSFTAVSQVTDTSAANPV